METRARFVESHISKTIAFQIRGLREEKGWSQEKFCEMSGMNQNAISRLENPRYGRPTITTLKRIAAVFDVALVVRFVPFSQLVDWVSGTLHPDKGLSADTFRVPNFADEEKALQFKDVAEFQWHVPMAESNEQFLAMIDRYNRLNSPMEYSPGETLVEEIVHRVQDRLRKSSANSGALQKVAFPGGAASPSLQAQKGKLIDFPKHVPKTLSLFANEHDQ